MSVSTRRQTGALPGTVTMHDAVHCGARTGISAAHSGFQYCRQDGRTAPSLARPTICGTVGRAASVTAVIVRCVLSYSHRDISADCTISQVARRICCLPQWNSERPVQPSVALRAQWSSRYCTRTLQTAGYEHLLSLSEGKSAVNGGSALPH